MATRSCTEDFGPQIDAAHKWANRAMIADGSVFIDRALWTSENIAEIRRAFVERPDEGGSDFLTKLKGQLSDATPASKQLMAEMLWITLLFPSNVSARKKLELVTEIWSSSGESAPVNSPLLVAGILEGVGSGGQGFNNYRWKELGFLVRFAEAMKALPQAERARIFHDYDRFLEFVDAIPEDGHRQLRHMLRYFAFPDRVERMSSSRERRKVLKAFRGLSEQVLKRWSHRQLDDELLKLRKEQESLHPDGALDFYEIPLREVWIDDEEDDSRTPAHVEVSPAPAKGKEDSATPYSQETALAEIFMQKERLTDILGQLERKKNIVLQGPPGVGKTFVARRLAWLLLGGEDDKRIEMVQFHPSMSYEDFVLGLRPDGKGGFSLKPGLFHRFCCRAQGDPHRSYVFIIDEINRGNLAKIFGELLMLIEADKRGEKHAVPLAYDHDADEKFYLPPNLHIIGTMNTADRSLALVDYALRRRFAFLAVEPNFGPAFRKAMIERRGCPEQLTGRICDRVEALNKIIASDTRSLGHGYQIGHSFFCSGGTINDPDTWYRQVIEFEIRPLLEEYWMDDPEKASSAVAKLLA